MPTGRPTASHWSSRGSPNAIADRCTSWMPTAATRRTSAGAKHATLIRPGFPARGTGHNEVASAAGGLPIHRSSAEARAPQLGVHEVQLTGRGNGATEDDE